MARRVAVACALGAIVAISFALRWRLLTATPFPTGIDGYFYPVQLRSLLAHGHLAYPASPFTFWFMAPFAVLTDPITGAKLGAAVGGALIALPAFALGERLAKGTGLAVAGLAAFSAGSTYLTIEYVKNGVGLTVALAALWLVLRATDRPSRGRIAAALGAVACALLAHKMAGGLVILVGAPAAIAAAVAVGKLRGRRLIYVLLATGGTLLALLIVGLAMPHRFLSPDDLSLLEHLLGSDVTWDALANPRVHLPMGHEALTGGILAVGAAVVLVVRPPRQRVVAWAVVGLGLLIAIPWLAVDDPQGLGFRLRLIAFVPRALCAAIILAAVPARALIAPALAVVALYVAPMGVRVDGEIVTHPALVTSALALQEQLPADAVAIVPERHIAFMVAWYADVAVALRPEHIPYARRWRVLPLSFIGAGSPLDEALIRARSLPAPPLGLHPRHPNGMVLVSEPTWDWLLAQLPPATRAHFARWPTI